MKPIAGPAGACLAWMLAASCGGKVEVFQVIEGAAGTGGTVPDAAAEASPTEAGPGGAAGAAGAGGAGGTLPDAALDTTPSQGGSGGSVSTPPSCEGLAPSCGPNYNVDCCKAAALPGGTFLRSYDGVTYQDNSHPATVSAFTLDVYEVTVSRFRNFVTSGHGTRQSPPAEGAGAHGKIPGSGWQNAWNEHLEVDAEALGAALVCAEKQSPTWSPKPNNEYFPINCVTWYEAFAFCAWDGARLPTEAEWNYAASGGDEQRVYPWSVPPQSTQIDMFHVVYGPGLHPQGAGSKSPLGDGRFGQANLAGNVWEWVLDWYAIPYADPCVDCANLAATDQRVHRGGAFDSSAKQVLSSYRHRSAPSDRSAKVGFRCAR